MEEYLLRFKLFRAARLPANETYAILHFGQQERKLSPTEGSNPEARVDARHLALTWSQLFHVVFI